MSTLTFLHLSDLLLGAPRAQNQTVALDEMCCDIRQSMDGRNLDFIVVAGDIAFSGKKAEYEKATRFFDQLLTLTELSKDRLFMVPGNHDINRQHEIPSYIQRTGSSREAVNEILMDRPILHRLLLRLHAYRQFVVQYLHRPADENSFHAVETLVVDGMQIAVLELNSVLFSEGDSDEGNLILGVQQVSEALDCASRADLRIAICHHPLYWLKDHDRSSVEPLISKECDFLLHGHQHHDQGLRLSPSGHPLIIVPSGRQWAGNRETMMYNIVHLDFGRNEGTVEIRQYSPRLKAYRCLDKLSFQSPSARRHVFPIPNLPTAESAPVSGSQLQKINHNLPQPPYASFVGRETELDQIKALLRPYPNSQFPVVAIDGIGGIGKTALALEAAYHYLRFYSNLPQEEQFDAIIWTSAKKAMFTADGTVRRLQSAGTVDSILNAILVTLGREDVLRFERETQNRLVFRTLCQQRTLLIVDNLETADDEQINSFIRELPAPTKVVVTSRHRTDVAYSVHLTSMSQEDGLALIAAESARHDVNLSLSDAAKLYIHTGGVPLAIVFSIALMGYGYNVDSVLSRLGQPNMDLARFCFEESVRLIHDTPAYRLLLAVSLFEADASREALGYVVGLEDDTLSRDEGLAVLERLSLVNRQGDRFTMLPLTRTYVEGQLLSEPDFAQQARRRLKHWLEQAQKIPAPSRAVDALA